MWGPPLKIEKDLERPREKTIPFVFPFEKTDGQCHADDYFGLLNCQKGRFSLLIKGLWGSDGAGCWRLSRRGTRHGVHGDGGGSSAAWHGTARPGPARHSTARHSPREQWHSRERARQWPCATHPQSSGQPRLRRRNNWMEMDGAAYRPRRGVSPRTITVSRGMDRLTDTDLCPRAHWRPRGAYVQFAGFRLQ